MTYNSVVGRETFRISFLIAALNDLKILASHFQNAYLNPYTKEKIYFYAGVEWKANKGRAIIIKMHYMGRNHPHLCGATTW